MSAKMDCIDHGRKWDVKGYGRQIVDGIQRASHRVAYCEAHGLPIEAIDGKVVRHTCDNPRCINPDHLLLGTHTDNIRDKVERGRSANMKLRKLTMEDAREIRRLYVPGGGTPSTYSSTGQRPLAKRFGVDHAVIRDIVANRIYKEYHPKDANTSSNSGSQK